MVAEDFTCAVNLRVYKKGSDKALGIKNNASVIHLCPLLCVPVWIAVLMWRPIVLLVNPHIKKPRNSLQCFLGTEIRWQNWERYCYKEHHWQSLTHGCRLQLKPKTDPASSVLLEIHFIQNMPKHNDYL